MILERLWPGGFHSVLLRRLIRANRGSVTLLPGPWVRLPVRDVCSGGEARRGAGAEGLERGAEAWRPRGPPSALLLFGLVLGAAARLTCVGDAYPKDGRCCQDCPPGYGMERRCSGGQDTECHPCRSGFYNEATNYEPCKPCTQCNQRSGSEPKQRCTPTQDTVCGCKPGTEPQDGFKRGVDCAPCPPGHFSPGDDQACKPWTKPPAGCCPGPGPGPSCSRGGRAGAASAPQSLAAAPQWK
ncbi:tumor necrosis factor receptor superfamily member 4 isoform X3 [Mustela lutreola]|uniref:tumor necrosis factor receptor superfamily member 4 isoform X3 n=1 Tax=Mustela lutreola TaxID=9666 RepID=UPI002796F19B|nr:tumor necrosis factor receptor superfamily member 4 isoform X3 [Mustela lutreola]